MQKYQLNQRKSFDIVVFAFNTLRSNVSYSPRRKYAQVAGISTGVATLGLGAVIRWLTLLVGVADYWPSWTSLIALAVCSGVVAYLYQLQNQENPVSWEKLLEQLLQEYVAATPLAHAELVALVAKNAPLLPLEAIQTWLVEEERALTAQ